LLGLHRRLLPAEEERHCRRWRQRRPSLMPLVWGIPKGMEALGGSAEVRGGLGYQKEVAGSPGHIGIDDGCHGHLQIPARNFDSLAASQVMGGEGKGRGGRGLIMGVARASKRAGSEGD
jgi:hypothetical protein